MVKTNIGNRIKSYRKEMGITQADLAKLVNVARPTVGSWEVNRTEPSIYDIENLARVFGVQKSELLGDSISLYKLNKSMEKPEYRDFFEFISENVTDEHATAVFSALKAMVESMNQIK